VLTEAEPGGICFSQTVYDVVKNRLAIKATFLGPRELKNIREAVPLYQILIAAAANEQPSAAGALTGGSLPGAGKTAGEGTGGTNDKLLDLLKGKGVAGKLTWLFACGILAAVLFVVLHRNSNHAVQPAPGKTTPSVVANTFGMKFVRIEPGRFTMGSPAAEEDHQANEKQHTRIIRHTFYLETTTVTQKQWKAVMGNDNNQSTFQGDDLPVEQVSWNDAMEFIGKLNASEKTNGRHYRLPSEGEWEYACRAGTMTPFSFGTTIRTDQVNYKGTDVYGTGQPGEDRQKTVPARSFQPNAWGLYQMHGNVWQWCASVYLADYGDGEITDPQEKEQMSVNGIRVLRGGSWYTTPNFCRSARRGGKAPDSRNFNIGFRLCMDLP
jgi:formylglycine-generating enzyme required for sulfatase activity